MKEPNFLIYTACCCSASNLTFHAFTLVWIHGGGYAQGTLITQKALRTKGRRKIEIEAAGPL